MKHCKPKRIAALLLTLCMLCALSPGVSAEPASDYPETANSGSMEGTMTFPSTGSENTRMKFKVSGGTIKKRVTANTMGMSTYPDIINLGYKGTIRPGDTISITCTGMPIIKEYSEGIYAIVGVMGLGNIGERDVEVRRDLSASTSYTVHKEDEWLRVYCRFREGGNTLDFYVDYEVLGGSKPEPAESVAPGGCHYCGREDSTVRFNDMYGEVSYRCNDEYDDAYEYAELDTVLHINDRIRAKEESGAILSFINMSTLTMRPESIVIVAPEKKNSKFKLIAGKFWVNLKKAVYHGVIDIEMSQAVGGITGPLSALAEPGDPSPVWLFTSSADITSATTGEVITLEPGQKATITANTPVAVETFDIEAAAAAFEIPMEVIEADRKVEYLDTEGIDGIVDIDDYPDGAKDDSVLYLLIGLFVLFVLPAGVITLIVVLAVRAGKKKKARQLQGAGYPHQSLPPNQPTASAWHPPQTNAPPTYRQTPPVNPVRTAPPPSQGSIPKFCSGCGQSLTQGAKFCPGCGKAVI